MDMILKTTDLCKNFKEQIAVNNGSLNMQRNSVYDLSRAMDYAKKDGLVKIQFQGVNDTLQITVTDNGKGFSEDALRHAKEQFYMEDQSRNSHMHFGMGLFRLPAVLHNSMKAK